MASTLSDKSSRSKPSTKSRQRASLACLSCREKRIRCSGLQPKCSTCESNGSICEYPKTGSNRKPPSKRYVEALLSRIERLEAQNAHLQAGQTLSDIDESNLDEQIHGSASLPTDVDSPPVQDPASELADTLGGLNVGEDGQLRHYGGRSNFHLVQGLLEMPSNTSAMEMQQRGEALAKWLALEVDVSDDLRDHLLDYFWNWQDVSQYIVPETQFLRDTSGKYSSKLLLLAILAVSSRYSDRLEVRTDPSDSNTAGQAFAEQAKIMLYSEIEAPTLCTVQAAMLLSVYETAIDKEGLAAIYCSMATRMAYNLGLHLDCLPSVVSGDITEEEAEARNVTWWGCYIVDKQLNLGFGRPSSIQESSMSCRRSAIVPEIEFREPKILPLTNPEPVVKFFRGISTYHHTCELLQLCTDTFDQIYGSRKPLSLNSMSNLVAKSHVELQSFYNKLPSHLRISISSQQSTLPHVYQFHLQFHLIIIVLHRPFLPSGRASMGNSPNDRDSEGTHIKESRSSAQNIAKILRAYRNLYTLRRIPIGAVHCVFTACVIHLFDASSPDERTRRTAIRMLQICVASLHEMSQAWSRSRRAIRGLRLLAQQWGLSISDSVFDPPVDEVVFNTRSAQGGVSEDSDGFVLTPDAPPDLVPLEYASNDQVVGLDNTEPLTLINNLDYEADLLQQPWGWDDSDFWNVGLGPFDDPLY